MAKFRHKKENIIAMMPARMGSVRLPLKNLALINGRPLIYYAIQAAKESGAFERIVINSENTLFAQIAQRYKVEFYQRPVRWSTSNTKSDFVVYDFIMKNPCDVLTWVNPISPLQTGKEIKRAVEYFFKNSLDTLITVKDEQVHCVYNGKPVNFSLQGRFAKTQELIPVQPFVYSVMIWRTRVFKRAFEKNGYAFFCGKVGFFPVSKLSAMIIKREEDLQLTDYIMRLMAKDRPYQIRYDKILFNSGRIAKR